jgi:hypothetical protein
MQTDPLWWPARSAAETVAGQIVSVEYDGIEYGELTVCWGRACGATPVTILDGGRSNTAAVMAIGWTACTSLPGRLETDEIRVSEVQSQLSMPPTRAVNNSGVAKKQVLCQWTREVIESLGREYHVLSNRRRCTWPKSAVWPAAARLAD